MKMAANVPFVLGGNTFGWTADRTTTFRILDAFAELGGGMIDTASVYSAWVPGHRGGESESLIGDWLSTSRTRDRVFIATKIGAKPTAAPNVWDRDLSASFVARAVDDALRRLRCDVIDLCQSHLDDSITPIEETLAAYEAAISAGKIRVIGASHYTAERLAEARRIADGTSLPPYASIQVRYNLVERGDYEGPLQELCRRDNVGVFCYSALAKGYLTGQYRTGAEMDASGWGSQLRRHRTTRGERILSALATVAEETCSTLAGVALAWVRAQPGVTAPIVAVTSESQLTELVTSSTLVLDSRQLEQLEVASHGTPDRSA